MASLRGWLLALPFCHKEEEMVAEAVRSCSYTVMPSIPDEASFISLTSLSVMPISDSLWWDPVSPAEIHAVVFNRKNRTFTSIFKDLKMWLIDMQTSQYQLIFHNYVERKRPSKNYLVFPLEKILWWCSLVIPAYWEAERQENQKFKVRLAYTTNVKSPWAT